MNVSLETHSQFLHAHFTGVKASLIGASSIPAFQEEILIAQPAVEKRKIHISKKILSIMLSLIIGLSCTIACILLIPSLYYRIFPAEVAEVSVPENTLLASELTQAQAVQEYQPPVDPTLPVGEWIVIPRIGVRTQPQATENPEEALQTGVWRVPDFGKPGEKSYVNGQETELPIILAAHRYGWQWWWQTDYWKYHSFYELPQTQPGDRVEIISNQRKWVYEIYAGEEGEQITDYSADLILYTCKFLNSPVRHFRYAKLINPAVDSQQLSAEL